MSLAEYMLEHGNPDDHDILDEFLDQRVYDSVAPNTPVQGVVKNEEVTPFFSDQENLAVSASIPKNPSAALFFTSPDDSLPHRELDAQDNDYLYVNPSVYRDGAMEISPFDKSTQEENDHAFMDSLSNQDITGQNQLHNQVHSLLHSNLMNHSSSQSSQSSQIQNGHFHSHPDQIKRDNAMPVANEHSYITSYDSLRDEVSKLKFGNADMNASPQSVDVLDPTYLDFSPAAMANLPFKMDIAHLPGCSRVETQIKIGLAVSPPPPQGLLHIPQDLISKSKFCLIDPISSLSPTIKQNLLYLDTYVLTSDLQKSCNICPRCIKREEKRASRRKSGNESETSTLNKDKFGSAANGKGRSSSWSDPEMMKKAIIFNCKEIVSFPAPSGLSNDSKSIELSARIICYCRHHKDTEGFKLLFLLKNGNGEVLAKLLSSPIMIMDRKKNTLTSSAPRSLDNSVAPSLAGSSTNLHAQAMQHLQQKSENNIDLLKDKLHPLSPNSVDESSEPTNTDTDGRGLKRKKLSIDDSLNTSTNPMFNDSMNGFSPVSNSDTNTNNSGFNTKPIPYLGGLRNLLHLDLPTIQRIIPAQGPIRGGIEVTLLGFNFRPNLQVKFGASEALATHCWSDTTIVTYLPPASQPGQVLVSFDSAGSTPFMANTQLQVFTYTDDTDRQLIELALQIVGLKMNGRLEDAKNIAKRIVGSDGKPKLESLPTINNAAAPTHAAVSDMLGRDWFDGAQKAARALTESDLSFEDMLVTLLSLVDLPNCPIVIPNWQLSNKQGHALLHLASMKNYASLIKFLIAHGCKVDIKDNQGLTPLFFASLGGHRELIQTFVHCKCNWNMKLSNDKHIKDYCDINVLDIFDELQASSDFSDVVDCDAIRTAGISKSMSIDSLNSMYSVSVGRHVSKMVMEDKVESKQQQPASESEPFGLEDSTSEFADSEFEPDDEDSDFLCESDSDGELSVSGDETASMTSESTIPGTAPQSPTGLWQKVKNVFNNDDLDTQLPSYDDLFPFGPSSSSKPKAAVERALNAEHSSEGSSSQLMKTAEEPRDMLEQHEDGALSSDSSDDIVAFINHPRKKVENDKMLFFFWAPILICILALFFAVSVMGYKFEFTESIKTSIRLVIGDAMVGKERISRVFLSHNGDLVLDATRRLMNEI